MHQSPFRFIGSKSSWFGAKHIFLLPYIFMLCTLNVKSLDIAPVLVKVGRYLA